MGLASLSTVVMKVERNLPEIRAYRLLYWVQGCHTRVLICDLVGHECNLRVYARQTLSFDISAALICGEFLANARAVGKPMSFPEAQISAIAAASDLSLCTRNVSDFETIKLDLINPWI